MKQHNEPEIVEMKVKANLERLLEVKHFPKTLKIILILVLKQQRPLQRPGQNLMLQGLIERVH